MKTWFYKSFFFFILWNLFWNIEKLDFLIYLLNSWKKSEIDMSISYYSNVQEQNRSDFYIWPQETKSYSSSSIPKRVLFHPIAKLLAVWPTKSCERVYKWVLFAIAYGYAIYILDKKETDSASFNFHITQTDNLNWLSQVWLSHVIELMWLCSVYNDILGRNITIPKFIQSIIS